VTSDTTRSGETGERSGRQGWVESTRTVRWALALALVLGALAAFAYWLAAGTHLSCQIVTVTSGGKATTTSTCGLPDVTDFIYVLAAVALLLLPDAQRLKIGGFEFERLASKVEEQTHEISQLRQTVSTTINIGSDLINQARNGFRETKDILDRVRGFLPRTPDIQDQLEAMDRLEGRIDAESWTDLFAGILTMHALIEAAQQASADALVRTSEAADTEVGSQEAESVISDYLRAAGEAGNDLSRCGGIPWEYERDSAHRQRAVRHPHDPGRDRRLAQAGAPAGRVGRACHRGHRPGPWQANRSAQRERERQALPGDCS
jgi:hypothetical protein